VEVTSASESAVGGLKEVIALISGNKVYSHLKYESGRASRAARAGHRAAGPRAYVGHHRRRDARKPTRSKSSWRPRTCHRYVPVPRDPAGNPFNTTYSAVRLTHLPTGLIVSCQTKNRRSKNRAKAERVLRSRLYELELEKQREQSGQRDAVWWAPAIAAKRSALNNFPQNRVTRPSHRSDAAPARSDHGGPFGPADLRAYQLPAGRSRLILLTIHTALLQGTKLLEDDAVIAPRLTAEVLLMHALQHDRAYLYAHSDDELPEVAWITLMAATCTSG